MANNRVNNRKISKDAKSSLEILKNTSSLLTNEIYDTTEKFHDSNFKDLKRTRDLINSVTSKYSGKVGNDVIDFFSSLQFASASNVRSNKDKIDESIEKAKKQFSGIDKLMSSPESYNLSDLFSQESGRFQLYSSYRLIAESIPQMSQALDTYVDNIMSPDDFTKTMFNVCLDGKTINSSDSEKNELILENSKNIIDKYKLENLTRKIIKESLMIGDCFVISQPLNKEIEKVMLSEDSFYNFNESLANYTDRDIEISDEEILQINKMLSEDSGYAHFEEIPVLPKEPILTESTSINEKLKNEYNILSEQYLENRNKFDDFSKEVKSNIADIINRNVQFSNDSKCLLEDNFEISKQFGGTQFKRDNFSSFNHTDIEGFIHSNNKNTKKRKSKKDEKILLNGSVLKILKPERIIKLSLDNFNYGYYYVENLEHSADMLTTGSYAMSSNIFTLFKSQSMDQPDIINSKYRMITDIFVRNISKKINKKFINNNPEFKDVIYNLLKQDYLLNKQVRIVYLRPSEVHHFGIGEEDYYDSIFKSILFVGKLYLSVLTSQVMLRLVRSPEKRVFYVNTDLDNDSEAVVQSFMRDIKTKDIKMSNFAGDINTLLQAVGCFTDYYVPVIDGNKPVDIDTLPGMNVEITNDFLEYLLKAMISGIGIPPEYLSYSEGTEFARSLSMMNGKFVRNIISKQKVYNEQFTELFRVLYQNEFLNEEMSKINKKNKIKEKSKGLFLNIKDKDIIQDTNKDSDSEEWFDINQISVSFPSPQSLNMQATIEKINSSKDLIDFVVGTLVDENDSELQSYFKRLVTKDMLNTIDWNKYEKLLESGKQDKIEDTLSKASNENLNGNSSSEI